MKDSQFLVSLFIWNKKEKFLKKNEFFFKKILDIFTEREYNIREGKGREGKPTKLGGISWWAENREDFIKRGGEIKCWD